MREQLNKAARWPREHHLDSIGLGIGAGVLIIAALSPWFIGAAAMDVSIKATETATARPTITPEPNYFHDRLRRSREYIGTSTPDCLERFRIAYGLNS